MTNFPRFSGLPEQLRDHANRIYRLERRPSAGTSEQPSIVANGSFESVNPSTGRPLQWDYFWKTGTPVVGSSSTAYDGAVALSITSGGAADLQRAYSEVTPALPGVLYYWQFAVRKIAGTGSANIEVEITFGDGPSLLPFGTDILGSRIVFAQAVATSGAYTLYSGYTTFSDPLTTYAVAELRFNSTAVGQTVLFDAVELRPVPPATPASEGAPAIGAARFLNTPQILPTGTNVPIDLNTPIYSNGVAWDNIAKRFEIGVAGLYQVNGQVRWTNGGVVTTRRIGSIWVNGVSNLDVETAPTAAGFNGCTLSKGIRLQVGDTVALIGHHTNGSNFNAFGSATQASGTFMELHYLGA